ncbi:hypothetical protein SYNPS1DRAFT_25903 [Syncephalis pseudoplumigaleata]|uniref:Uncharacterized protein n=1 Tax=Syncephalis pseudoplumigaleata TaxID=1712513 RepID=A0A4V1J0Q5_9FUNG|nr:hypothetical protein SYNPS1DRAFT_25903 [Syncephalis pseudoplumigaleata]|eukprot:RKP22379.1 hypothetical protein SYNPS1DRAFT_25903 [Syncephalis pseudoplumigaleata]
MKRSASAMSMAKQSATQPSVDVMSLSKRRMVEFASSPPTSYPPQTHLSPGAYYANHPVNGYGERTAPISNVYGYHRTSAMPSSQVVGHGSAQPSSAYTTSYTAPYEPTAPSSAPVLVTRRGSSMLKHAHPAQIHGASPPYIDSMGATNATAPGAAATAAYGTSDPRNSSHHP